ncbi:hypothetical protein DPMN_127691 [Dreissena polymorpha]|uniref:Uncharacterized protein n=1 Tax=Dreissena polymorpha TaxID=45954 RepID=A0A9D4H1Q1_DREPO|nr:hypothetical protein DPMN_127691 [Dreissena polymorpha]
MLAEEIIRDLGLAMQVMKAQKQALTNQCTLKLSMPDTFEEVAKMVFGHLPKCDESLFSSQEEPDTRIILHSMHIKEFQPDTQTIICFLLGIGDKLGVQSYLTWELETNEDSST